MIPGVGAMYNEQYAKGIVHLAIFAVLMSLSDHVSIFGLFGFAWWCYMVFDAYHTAKARRDGTPLPDPFGLNDIGERLGFAKTTTPPVAGVPPVPPAQPVAAAEPIATQEVPPRASWGAPEDRFGYTNVSPVPPIPPVPPYGAGYGYSAPPVPPVYPYGAVPPVYPVTPGEIPPAPARGGFPAGAIWLIALGVIFLVGNTGLFRDVPESALVGIALIGLAVWIFVRKLLALQSLAQFEGPSLAGLRVLRASRGAVWVLLIGVIMILNAFHLIVWTLSWPYFIILAGVMALLERTVSNAAAANAWHYGNGNYPGTSGYPPTLAATPEVSAQDPTQEGR